MKSPHDASRCGSSRMHNPEMRVCFVYGGEGRGFEQETTEM